MPGRITYNGITIDLDREWNAYSDPKVTNKATVQAQSGVEATTEFYTQQSVTASRRLISGDKVQEIEQFVDYAKGGATFMFERDRDLGAYIGFEGGDHTTTGDSLKTNDGVAGTFTRALTTDSSYYVDPSTGLLTVVDVVDKPRFPAGKFGRGILIEGARTNIITHPSDFSNASWTKSNTTVSTNTTETLDPAGGNTADKITATAAGGSVFTDTGVALGTDDGTCGFWLKAPVPTAASIGFVGLNNTAITVTTEWAFYQLTNNTLSGATNWVPFVAITNNSDSIYAYAAQCEVGVDVTFASQTIGAVSTASVARSKDVLYYAPTNILNETEGSVVFWVNNEWSFGAHPEIDLLQVGKNGGSSFCGIESGTNLNVLKFFVNQGSGSVGGTLNSSDLSASVLRNTWYQIAATWNTTISNGLKLYVNGDIEQISANTAFSPLIGADRIAIGNNRAGNFPAFAVFDDVYIYKRALNATEVSALYNRGRGIGVGRNRYTSMILDEYNKTERRGGRFDIELRMHEELT